MYVAHSAIIHPIEYGLILIEKKQEIIQNVGLRNLYSEQRDVGTVLGVDA